MQGLELHFCVSILCLSDCLSVCLSVSVSLFLCLSVSDVSALINCLIVFIIFVCGIVVFVFVVQQGLAVRWT